MQYSSKKDRERGKKKRNAVLLQFFFLFFLNRTGRCFSFSRKQSLNIYVMEKRGKCVEKKSNELKKTTAVKLLVILVC
jgi:hypothetical protein